MNYHSGNDIRETVNNAINTISNADMIVCIGAGKNSQRIVDIFDDTVLGKIRCFVDNDKSKHGNMHQIADFEYPIVGFDELCEMKMGNVVFIITTVDYHELYSQIREFVIDEVTPVFSLSLIKKIMEECLPLEIPVPPNLKISNKQIIPKKIHYCWFGKKDIPKQNRIWMESWKKYCPDYEIIEWNESNYDISKNKYMYEAYKAEKYGFVPDFARLDIIYNEGGIYLDVDVELVSTINDLLFQKAFIGFETSRYVNCGSGFGAIKRLQVVKDMMDEYTDLSFFHDDGTMNTIPSPIYQTKVLLRKGLILNGQYQLVDGMTILPQKVLCGKNESTGLYIVESRTKMIHHFDASWVDKETKAEVDSYRRIFYLIEKNKTLDITRLGL